RRPRLAACGVLVAHREVEGGVPPEHTPLRRTAPKAEENRQRVRWDECAYPLDDVAVVVVMRRLDQNELEASLWLRQCTHHANKSRSRRRAGDAYINQTNFNIVVRCEKGPELAANSRSTTCSTLPDVPARRLDWGSLQLTKKRRRERLRSELP